MSASDIFIAALVLIGLFLLAYSAIRHQGIFDTVVEIKQIFQDKSEDIIESTSLKYN